MGRFIQICLKYQIHNRHAVFLIGRFVQNSKHTAYTLCFSSIITNYHSSELLVGLPLSSSATHLLHNSAQHGYARNAFEVIYLLKSKNLIRMKRQRSRPEKWEYMRHVLFFNTIFLRGVGVASGVRTKKWFQFFKNKQNDIFSMVLLMC